ncbi:unnamed protein product [Cochlearia groenlandica]
MQKEYPNMGLYLTVDKIGKSDSGNDLHEEVSYDKLVEAVAEEERFHKEGTSNVCDGDANFQEMGGDGFVDVMLTYVDECFIDEVDVVFDLCQKQAILGDNEKDVILSDVVANDSEDISSDYDIDAITELIDKEYPRDWDPYQVVDVQVGISSTKQLENGLGTRNGIRLEEGSLGGQGDGIVYGYGQPIIGDNLIPIGFSLGIDLQTDVDASDESRFEQEVVRLIGEQEDVLETSQPNRLGEQQEEDDEELADTSPGLCLESVLEDEFEIPPADPPYRDNGDHVH